MQTGPFINPYTQPQAPTAPVAFPVYNPPPVQYPAPNAPAITNDGGGHNVKVRGTVNPNLAIAGIIVLVAGGVVTYLFVRKDVKDTFGDRQKKKQTAEAQKELEQAEQTNDSNLQAAKLFGEAMGINSSWDYWQKRAANSGNLDTALKAAALVTDINKVESLYKAQGVVNADWLSRDLWADINNAFWDSGIKKIKAAIETKGLQSLQLGVLQNVKKLCNGRRKKMGRLSY